MGKNKNKYYLSVDDNIVSFENVPGFDDMENFLRLSIFTGLFKDAYELIECITRLGLLSTASYRDIAIVKRLGNCRDGYHYVSVTDDIVYSRTLDYLSANTLNDFLFKNRENYNAIVEILNECKEQTLTLINAFKIKIRELNGQSSQSTGEELEELYLEIEKRKGSLKNFRTNIANMEAIKNLIREFKSKNGILSREKEIEYMRRLDTFVTNEVYYVYGRRKYPNERGLVRLASIVSRVAVSHPELETPFVTISNSSVRLELLRMIKHNMKAVSLVVIEPSKPLQEDADDEHDSFMFLEEDDYSLPECPTEAQRECHEDALEGLRLKKKDYQ